MFFLLVVGKIKVMRNQVVLRFNSQRVFLLLFHNFEKVFVATCLFQGHVRAEAMQASSFTFFTILR